MLGNWRSHFDYQIFLLSSIKEILKINPTIVEYYSSSIKKLYILNLWIHFQMINKSGRLAHHLRLFLGLVICIVQGQK